MKLLISPADLTQQFNILLDKYSMYYFATAWAGVPDTVFENLLNKSDRIKQLVVGIHFYQTDPAFFEKFIGSKNVKAILQPDGTFHPKMFLFYDDDDKWTLLIGSGNFTKAAFIKNTEAAIMIESSEATPDILADARRLIADSWSRGRSIDKKFYQAYQLQWAKARNPRNELAGAMGMSDILVIGVTDFMKLSWHEYVAEFSNQRQRINRRFKMLETVRSFFASGRSLLNMTEDERRLICGNPNNIDLPGADNYASFGTSGNGQFMNKMIEGNTHISNALDKIPLIGDVRKQNFDDFLDIFLHDPDITTGWVSSAGRLLALKRPDTFYNITNANREGFCRDFGNTQSQTRKLENYWQLVIQKVQLSTWYNDADPKNAFERKLYGTRAAMLDVLYYS